MRKILLILFLLFTIVETYAQISKDDHNRSVDLILGAQKDLKSVEYIKAIEALKPAIKLDSTLRAAYLYMFQACYFTKNYETAKKYLQKAKCIYVEDDEIIYYLGKILQAEKKDDLAIAEFSKAIEFGKKNGEDYPIVYDYYSSRGTCLLRKNDCQKALDDFNYALKLNDTKGSVYTNRGIALFKLNRNDEACESWQKALELGEVSAQFYLDQHCK